MDKSRRHKRWLEAAYLTLCLLFAFGGSAQVAVRAPGAATPGNIAVFGASPNLILDGGPTGVGTNGIWSITGPNLIVNYTQNANGTTNAGITLTNVAMSGYTVLVHNGSQTGFTNPTPLESANASAVSGDVIEGYNTFALSNIVRNTNVSFRGHDCTIMNWATNADNTVCCAIQMVNGSVSDVFGSNLVPVSGGQVLVGMNDNHGDPHGGTETFRNVKTPYGDSDGFYWSDTTNGNDVVNAYSCVWGSHWDTAALFGTNNTFYFFNCTFTNSGVSQSTAGGALLRGAVNISSTATWVNCIFGVSSVTNTPGTTAQSAVDFNVPGGATNFIIGGTIYVGGAQTNTVGIQCGQSSYNSINGVQIINTTGTNVFNAVVGIKAQTAGTVVRLRATDIFGNTGPTNAQIQISQAPSVYYDASDNINTNICFPPNSTHLLYGGGDIGTPNGGFASGWGTNLYLSGTLSAATNLAAVTTWSNLTANLAINQIYTNTSGARLSLNLYGETLVGDSGVTGFLSVQGFVGVSIKGSFQTHIIRADFDTPPSGPLTTNGAPWSFTKTMGPGDWFYVTNTLQQGNQSKIIYTSGYWDFAN